jgi:hypothetical protein
VACCFDVGSFGVAKVLAVEVFELLVGCHGGVWCVQIDGGWAGARSGSVCCNS